MAILQILQLLTVAECVSAFAIRNDPQLNLTAESPEVTTVDVLPASLVTTDSSGKSIWRPKVHDESSATGFEDATTAGGDSRVRLEATATEFDVTIPTTTEGQGSKDSITMIDIGTIIQSLITSTEMAVPTVHFESSATDWDEVTSTVHFESSASDWGTVSSEIAHFESSASGWGQTNHQDPSTPQSTRYKPVEVSDDPWTKDLQTPQTTAPDGLKNNQPQVTTVPSRTITDFPPPPAITHDGITVRPVAVTRRPTVTLPGGGLTTTDKIEFQVAIGSSTLSIGVPITINNVVVGVTTDAAGSTVLRAGDMTTMLPEPAAGEVRTIAVNTPERLSVMTAVINGTTKYVLAGQTLAPGQPVTIGDTPISITISSGKTVLYVGETTTTLIAAASDIQTITDWTSISAGTQGIVENNNPASASPTTTRSGSSESRKVDAAFAYCAMGMAMFIITT
ncbi:hypothetical protein BU25DRAFT_1448 [Macroventuria anomochaeta]|uniref:Uncharacterized protein n=1 Tax=Macroventuria anomochaeta TaxID=301207 RepID=A0ACB6SIN2_9PLEO|nr:uncharacterized protein BU25DRAFT_1448 [Macroventuria anomochaeta]KAF2633179.1 hypothetical protein BU25DRAFT_1448 [Macroventuria anomochaeta]